MFIRLLIQKVQKRQVKFLLPLFIFCCINTLSFSQVLLDPDELKNARTYTSLEEALQQPDSVFKLKLNGKKLAEFPVEILRLTNLQSLNLSKNRIKTIPSQINELKNLQELDVSRNKIYMLPPEIGELKNLVRLNLNRNVITALPESIGNLAELEFLEMWDNELKELPDEIRYLKHLKTFELRGILFSESEQMRVRQLLPNTVIRFSPPCACKE